MNQKSKQVLFNLGRPVAPLYSEIMKLRAYLYRKNVLKHHDLPVPVISVGNLTLGGTGKTPLVIYLAWVLKEQGYHPGVISRGYRGTADQPVNVVSDGTSTLLSPLLAGDEPHLIAGKLPGIVVVTGKKRIYPALEAINTYGCDVIILDDGFQHLSLSRNLDLVLFDVNYFAGNSRVFPGGDLREPISSLARCDAFVLTGTSEANRDRTDKCTEILLKKFPGKPVIQLAHNYSGVAKHVPEEGQYCQETVSLNSVPATLHCFCGIAQPERFKASLEENGIGYQSFQTFNDHHLYSAHDLADLHSRAAETGATGFLTTEKDMVKLTDAGTIALPIYTPLLEVTANKHLDELILSVARS